jgi:hypothetical protein
MIEAHRSKVLVRVVSLLGLEVLLMLGLFLSLDSQSSGFGPALEKQLMLAENIAPNAGFEDLARYACEMGAEPGPSPDKWHCEVVQGNPLLALEIITNVRTGEHAVSIDATEDDIGFWRSDDIPINASAGMTFQVTFAGWIKAASLRPGAQAFLRLKFFRGTSYLNYTDSNYIVEPTADWVRVEGSAEPPNGATTVRLLAQLNSPHHIAHGFVFFDDVSVVTEPIGCDLALDVTSEANRVSMTDAFNYLVTAANTGGAPCTSVRLTGTLDSRITLNSWNTDPETECNHDGQTSVCHRSRLSQGDRLSASLSVSVTATGLAQDALNSIFEVSAEEDDGDSLAIRTPIVDFVISECGSSIAAPNIPLHYVHTLTNIGSDSTAFTLSAHTTPGGCGVAVAWPKHTESVAQSGTLPVTLTFTPSGQLSTDVCTPTLGVQAWGIVTKTSTCRTVVISPPLGLDLVANADRVPAGKQLTYTVDYIYAGGLNAEGLRITFTLEGPAWISSSNPSPDDSPQSSTTYTWSPPAKPSGGIGEITVVASVPSTATGIVTAIAQMATSYASPISESSTTEIGSRQVYMPLVLRCWPRPGTPVLSTISPPGDDASYIVSWDMTFGAEYYSLQEATDPTFSDASTIYTDADTFHTVTSRCIKNYHYRVTACNCGGCSEWSNVESVEVRWECGLNNTCPGGNGPLVSDLTYYGTFTTTTDRRDYFHFDMTTPHTIELWLTNIPIGYDYDLALRNAGCDLIVFSNNYDNSAEHILTGILPAGRYYVQVYYYVPGSAQPYHLRVVYE